MKILYAALACILINCAHEMKKTETSSKDHPAPQDLESTQLHSKIDEMDTMLQKQQEQIAALETLLEESKKTTSHEKAAADTDPTKPAGDLSAPLRSAQDDGVSGTSDSVSSDGVSETSDSSNEISLSPRNRSYREDTPNIKTNKEKSPPKKEVSSYENYELRLAHAKTMFQQKIWHKAYLAFSSIDKEFSPQLANGEPLYWMGRCWYEMKEYQSAKSLFTHFLKSFPKHSLESSAQIFLAKSEMVTGYEEEAVKILESLIHRYPTGHDTDIAKKMLASQKNSFKEKL
jgi:TolA-binding protein